MSRFESQRAGYRSIRLLSFMLAAVFAWLAVPDSATAASNRFVCIRFSVRTIDSGRPVPHTAGDPVPQIEDHWTTGDQSGFWVPARGVRVRVDQPGGSWSETFDSDPETGCFDFFHQGSTFDLIVFGYTTDSKGNAARIYNGALDSSGYPGQTYSHFFRQVTIPQNNPVVFYAGAGLDYWTTQAAAGFSLYRYNDPATDQLFHIGFNSSVWPDNSCAFANSAYAMSIEEGQLNAYLALGRCIDHPQRENPSRRKFLVSHEMGHAVLFLQSGFIEYPAEDFGWDEWTPHHQCGIGESVSGDNLYTITSVEWSSLAFKEGWAHFYSARVWNDAVRFGAFNWFGTPWDTDLWDAFGGTNDPGGRYENLCCTPSNCSPNDLAGAGTIGDWLRFLWDVHTWGGQCPAPTKHQMSLWHYATLANGGLTRTNYFAKAYAAAAQLGFDDCIQSFGEHNGVDN